jgi:hypothetical protein
LNFINVEKYKECKNYNVFVANFKDCKVYIENKKLHRLDGPAIEYKDGTKVWYYKGRKHRDDGPAYEGNDGDKSWYIHDHLHQENAPAVIYANGDEEWWYKHQLHREGGPAVSMKNATEAYYSFFCKRYLLIENKEREHYCKYGIGYMPHKKN